MGEKPGRKDTRAKRPAGEKRGLKHGRKTQAKRHPGEKTLQRKTGEENAGEKTLR